VRDARAPNQGLDLARADQGHPRAALDANDLWIPDLRAQHPTSGPNRRATNPDRAAVLVDGCPLDTP